MLLMVEKGTRGGVSLISNRYGKSNNKYMGNKFVASEPSKYIMYLDANNLYGWGKSKPLPTHGFEWMKVSELETWEVVYNWGFWGSHFTLIFPHFTLFLPPLTTFLNLLNILKHAFRYIIQLLHHHIIYLTNTSKSSQLHSISLKLFKVFKEFKEIQGYIYLTYIFKSFQLNSIS